MRVQDAISDDPRSTAEHTKAMIEEMKKSKPRDSVVLPLMKSTFPDRRLFVQNDAGNVTEILESYPAFSRPAVINKSCNCT